MNVKVKIAIKEFFMRDRCVRSKDGLSVTVPAEGSRQQVQKYKEKFIKEAQNLSSIKHKNVVNVSDVFEENNTVYYVMQYLPGGSMTEKVKGNEVGRMAEDDASKFIHQIAAALTYLHDEKHMCHLDVKPANILLSSEGEAILIDFGISKTFDANDGSGSTSSVSYSNNYAPLEQYQALKQFSPQTDLYSLGATFYFMLTGNTPAEASELMENGFPKCPYFVTPHTWHALEKAMQPRKKDRPESVAQWIEMLDGKRPIENPKPAPKPAPSPSTQKPKAPANSDETVVGGSQLNNANSDETVVGTMAAHKKPNSGKPQPKKRNSMSDRLNGWSTIQKVIIFLVFVLCIGIGALIYKMMVLQPRNTIEQRDPSTPTTEALEQLSSTDLTMARIQEIERDVIHNGNEEEERELRNRISALKHLYLEGFQSENRTVKSLMNIYVVHSGEFSEQQRQLMVSFFNQPKEKQMQWEMVREKVKSFDDFKSKVSL